MNTAQCAQVEVPLDYSKPNGRKISIAVSRFKHTDEKNYQGVLFVNPGGPGGSGLAYATSPAGSAASATRTSRPSTTSSASTRAASDPASPR